MITNQSVNHLKIYLNNIYIFVFVLEAPEIILSVYRSITCDRAHIWGRFTWIGI